MKFIKILVVFGTAYAIAGCDNGPAQLKSIDGEEPNEGVETVDFFGMEDTDNETIAFEPELGFALPARGPLSVNTAVLGSTTAGRDYRTDCEAGQVLAGLAGFATGNRVHQLSTKCVEVDDSGQWLGTPQVQGTTIGITSGSPFNLDCSNGQAITGITGVTRNDAIAGFQIQCHALTSATTTTGNATDSNFAGENSQSVANQLCGSGAVATGLHGRADVELRSAGLVCNESPATAGRWSNPFNWPVQAVHAIMTPQGNVLSYGFRDGSGNLFDYDIWNPEQGTAASSHNTFASDQGINSFCNASIIMPGNGNILMPGGTKLRSDNAGVADVPVYDPQTGGLSRAADMANRRWYPTTVTLPNGEILVAGGRDVAGVPTNTPEIYSPETNEWRSLFGANMAGLQWTYPRLWVAKDGRVFGISETDMFYINPQGSGALQRVGNFDHAYRTQAEATAVMYQPGKILQFGGNVSNGTSALVVDINGNTPQARPTTSMKMSRSAWANSQVLADGKVMAIGGSRVVNDAVTAALNPEIWDPETEEWTVVSGFKWPRLYHSNSVLLKDGTVIISGGGNPGPVTNYNAEIFSPPYLFNADGSPAARPEITWAPQQGAYGDTIAINTDGSPVSRVTFIKTSSVTHSFNVEQRFMDLTFSAANNSVQVQLPATATDATPGYYLMFVINEQGTPSEATILKLGDEPGATPPPVVVTPEPPEVDTNNLLVNGGFEQGKSSWQDCSNASLSTISNNAHNGASALTQLSGACLFQEFAVQPDTTYSVSCDAYNQNSAYSSISLNTLDPNYNEINRDEISVSATAYTATGVTLEAPANAQFAAVTLYSEGPTYFDSCVVTANSAQTPVTQPAPPVTPEPLPPIATNILINGDFSADKSSWLDCANTQLTTVENDNTATGRVLQVANAGCIYQEFAVTPGKQYQLQCNARSEGTQYSSISFQMADKDYNELGSDVSVIGPGNYQVYTSTLTAPATSTTSAVTLYSEDITRVDTCHVEEI